MPRSNVEVLAFPDCQLHEKEHEIIREIETRLYDQGRSATFDVVLTHAEHDTHADHRVVHESTLSAVRDFHGSVLFYQSPSTKPNAFRPTFFVKLDQEDISQKNLAITAHASQREKRYTRMTRTIGMVENWSIFLRMPDDVFLEAFEGYKSFFWEGSLPHRQRRPHHAEMFENRSSPSGQNRER